MAHPPDPVNAPWGTTVVVSGTSSMGSTTRLAEQELACHLARHVPVLYVDPPVSPVTLWRGGRGREVFAPRLRQAGDNLACLTPVVAPGKDRGPVHPVTDRLTGMEIRRALRHLGADPLAVVLTLPQRRLLDCCPADHWVYWAKDDHQAGATLYGLDAGRLARVEAELAANADTVLVASPPLRERFSRLGASPRLFPNAVDPVPLSGDALPGSETRIGLPRPVAGFFGTLSDRIDWRLLHAVAESGTSLVLVGEERHLRTGSLSSLLERENVRRLPAMPFEEAAALFPAVDVGLVPYTEDTYNRASFPLKVLEYLAAGVGVVSTDLPAARWLDTHQVHVASTPEAFAAAAAAMARQRHDERAVATRRAVADAHTWHRRADELWTLLNAEHHAAAA